MVDDMSCSHKWIGGDGDYVTAEGTPLTEDEAGQRKGDMFYTNYSTCELCGIVRTATYKRPGGSVDTDVNQWELRGEYLEPSDEGMVGYLA